MNIPNFDFSVGQIVSITHKGEDGKPSYNIPALVTKVHPKDNNGYHAYDYLIPVRGESDYVGFIEDEKRYLWRWIDPNAIPPLWFIKFISELELTNEEWGTGGFIDKREMFYLNKDAKEVRPFANNSNWSVATSSYQSDRLPKVCMSVHKFVSLVQKQRLIPNKSKSKGRNCRVYKVKYRDNTFTKLLFLVKCNEDYSKRGGHLVYIKLQPSKVSNPKSVRKAVLSIPMKVFCSCPAYKYWGSQYLATLGGYQIAKEDKETRKAIIRDPKGLNAICKHLSAVSTKLVRKSIKSSFKGNMSTFRVDDEIPLISTDELLRELDNPILNSVEGIDEDNIIETLQTAGLI